MNPLDWLLAALFAYSVIRAAMRGLLRESFALGGLIAGFFLACWNYRIAADRLRGVIDSPPLRDFLAFLLILLATMTVTAILGKLLSKSASAVGLGFLDRLGGAAFGLLRGALLVLALLLAMTALLPASARLQKEMQTSLLGLYFLRANDAVCFVMPSSLRQRWTDGLQRIRDPRLF